MIDLDHNATTPLDPRVAEAMAQLLVREDLGNPSSPHALGRAARDVVETARRRVARAVGAEALGVTFTSGGTEADNLAVLGVARALRAAGAPHGVLGSRLEHPAVTAAMERLRAEGVPIAWIAVDAAGRIDPAEVAQTLRARPELGMVTLSAANHELGNAYDVAGWVAAVRAVRPEVVVHADAVQALGKVPTSLDAWGVDLLSLSAHKIGGPAGVGALVHRKGLRLSALGVGGQQERGRRPGTEATLLVHGLGVAAQWAAAEQATRHAATAALRQRALAGLTRLGARIHGDPEHHTGNTISAAFADCEGELVMMSLDLVGIAISTGAACSAGVAEPSAVLRGLGQSPDQAREAIRISLSPRNTEADVDALIDALAEIVPRVRASAAPPPVAKTASAEHGGGPLGGSVGGKGARP